MEMKLACIATLSDSIAKIKRNSHTLSYSSISLHRDIAEKRDGFIV
jgi:hypothetical protein